MPSRDLFTVHCPCCGQTLYIDAKRERAFSRNPDKQEAGVDLDQVIKETSGDAQRLESQFKDALDQHANQKETLEQMFDEAKKKAAQDKDKGRRPPSPFDLE